MALRARLSESGSRVDLSSWARAVLAEIHDGSRVANAIMHPLGFICLQLYRSAGWGMCMHIWKSPGTSPTLTTTPIHSHSWDLSSQVICGRLENIEIRVIEGSPTPTHRVLEITTTDGIDVIHPTQRLVYCTRTESAHIGAGDTYWLPAGAFHVSRPSAAGLTATVLLANYRNASPEFALGRLDSRDCVVARQPCAPEELQLMAGVALRNLTAIQGAKRPSHNDGI